MLRSRMTPEERRLWYDYLKKLPATVNRQKVIGPYVVDFYCRQVNTVIELDGSQHRTQQGFVKDETRDRYLKSLGIRVLRYSNDDIQKHFDAVCEDISRHIFPQE
ncbi:MAG: endonuclease domain-containing protein [Clostridia bacterium]|nr:endonuclease domain-containing protein [Clostridia bacterium]MBQ9785817.1 endonuclease domain-containing protein [Clostridia bacterium]